MVTARNIGVPVNPPARECDDGDCPFHGKLSVRGIILTGKVYKKKMNKTIVVERDYLVYVKKYKRYERRRSRIPAHLPPCIDVEVGDVVKIAECRPLSKTVSFVVIENLKKA
ncbi:MAG TPA: 30S ribosomal protein S17 [Candidatus Caldiarchaeum subterraneum]|uniref:Small ribosomal subunit protein uS17 n=1 Tax=Caldiarchaeum subterraneum TaxID=311458 RepID=A0A832ZX25_CALS0|nr:30S ribosomal protein S17 [Aigarchaeota archaeon]HIQ30096.1 30S ribosomal protein S17 [Candidatus Caldarchaeum subterraneum]